MTEQEQIEEMAKIVDEMYNVYTTTADDIADGLYNAGYRKTFTSDIASDTLKLDARELITEQEKEIERLKAENACLLKACEEQFTFDTTENKKYSIFNSIRKEFAEKLKKYSYTDNCFTDGKWHRYVLVSDIDELLKEYKE